MSNKTKLLFQIVKTRQYKKKNKYDLAELLTHGAPEKVHNHHLSRSPSSAYSLTARTSACLHQQRGSHIRLQAEKINAGTLTLRGA